MNELHEQILRFVSHCLSRDDEEYLIQLIDTLKKENLTTIKYSIIDGLNLPFDLSYLAFELFQVAEQKRVSAQILVDFLNISYKMGKLQKADEAKISPVWSGPSFEHNSITLKTFDTVKHLIDSANDEVFIVGYNFSVKHDSIKLLIEKLEEAASRKCRINIIVHNKKTNFQELLHAWTKERYLINIFYWKGNEVKDYTSLHSKLMIIDQQKLFLTSANFSFLGFHKNIETGLVIENHSAVKSIRNQFQLLLKNNEMIKLF